MPPPHRAREPLTSETSIGFKWRCAPPIPGWRQVRSAKESTSPGREEHWFSVEDESLMFSKRDMHAIAEAVRAIDTDHPIYVWIQAENDSEYGLEVFRDTIKPD